MTHLKTWWFREDSFTNFGDELGWMFLELLGHEIEYVPFGEADILTTGSILQQHNNKPLKAGTIIWGTGWHRIPIQRPLPPLDVRAVRGQLTATAIGSTTLNWSDPGILASHFWPAEKKEHGLGFVRHYIDDRPPMPGVFEIDTRAEPEKVCREIASCHAIVSSSLHGCIVAQSYGIPYMRLHDRRVVGEDTKWIDFTSSLTLPVARNQKMLLEGIADL